MSDHMTKQKNLALTREDQKKEFQIAKELVEDDFSEDMTHGEVVKTLCKAYSGRLDEIPDA